MFLYSGHGFLILTHSNWNKSWNRQSAHDCMPAGDLNHVCRNQPMVMDSYMPSLWELNQGAFKWPAWIPSKSGSGVLAMSAFACWSVAAFEVVLKVGLPHSKKKKEMEAWRNPFVSGVLTYWGGICEGSEWREADCRNFWPSQCFGNLKFLIQRVKAHFTNLYR